MSKADSGPPSYEESTSSTSYESTGTRVPRGQQLIDRLTVARSQHIRHVIEKHVCPIVEYHAQTGISRTVLVLLPSDVQLPQVEANSYDTSVDSSKAELMGFATEEDVQQVRLEGPMNKTSFWRQAGVIDDFRRALQDRLSTLPELQVMQPAVVAPEKLSETQQPRKKGFFGRYGSSFASVREDPVVRSTTPVVAPGERVRVEAGLEEICLRTISEFGLYETINRQGIIVKVNANIC